MNEVFTRNLIETRKKQKLTQKQLADMAGCSAAAIGWYERGEKVPTLETAARIAGSLGVSLDWLWGREKGVIIPTGSGTMGTLMRLLAAWTESSIQPDIDGVYHPIVKDKDGKYYQYRAGETIPEGYIIVKEQRDIRLVFPPCVLGDYVEDWKRVLKMYREGSIDRDMYIGWIERKANEADGKKAAKGNAQKE